MVRKGSCPSLEVTAGSTCISSASSEWAQGDAAFP